ncbi:PIG-L deacetylase family protein [Staphylothermus hellenicus]|nr:PIG-L deacetylase family protein [Staphylothermus hellenicus]
MMAEILQLIKQLPEQEVYRIIVKQYIAKDFDQAFDNAHRILCISPHPDDCEVGVGGLIAKYAGKGKDVYLVVMTDGSRGTRDPRMTRGRVALIRRREQEEAGRVLGVKNIYWLNYPDGELPYSYEVINKLVTLYRLLKPDIVLAPDPSLPYEAHPDHLNTGRAASTAAIFSGMPLYNRVDLETGLSPHSIRYIAYYYTSRPNTYIDITDTIEKKLEALRKHESQFKESWTLIEALIRVLGAIYGRKINVEYADAVKLVPAILLHAVPFTEYV